jgi:LmbE family N-acetylglucosaminyl deacetylase
MRRREALCSLARLGIGESSATFLAFPDQGIATLARHRDTRLRDALRAIIERVQPTVIVTPSTFDLHPDHRAISYFAHSAAPDATIATYVVHGSAPASRLACRLDLNEDEQRRKREAIQCHVSQLALSRERFLWYAQQTESFYAPEFDLVRVESVAREWWTACRHAVRVCFGLYPSASELGVQPAADVQDSAGDVPGLL